MTFDLEKAAKKHRAEAEARKTRDGALKLKEIAERINKHLRRIEADPKLNTEISKGLHRFYRAGAGYWGGRYVSVVYISYQGRNSLTRDEALKYLAWLDAGHAGNHYEALR